MTTPSFQHIKKTDTLETLRQKFNEFSAAIGDLNLRANSLLFDSFGSPEEFSSILQVFNNFESFIANDLSNIIYDNIFTSENGSFPVPSGTTDERDSDSPLNPGLFRFNTDTSSFEGYDGTSWGPIAGNATGGGTDQVFYLNGQTVTANYTIPSGKNAFSTGPIEVDVGVIITIPENSRWVVIGNE